LRRNRLCLAPPGAGSRGVRADKVMDSVTAARSLMGLSLAFHIAFTAVGIGIPVLMFLAEGLALRTGEESYRLMARRWTRVAAVLFAIGAVSGTILSFEFGLLWSPFMEEWGEVFGFPFVLEGFAFFTEAIFLAIYIFGWNRLSPVAHWLVTIPIAMSAAASAFFVISANAWMNQPEGFDLVNGQVTNVRPLEAMFNPAMPYEVIHGTLASYVATGFAVAGIYALAMLRGERSEYNRRALVLALAVGAVAIPLQIVSGDFNARFLARNQPEKFAAMEGQFETERGAPLRIGGIPNPATGETPYAIEIPKLGSFLAFHDFNAEIKGLNSFPVDERPDPRLVHIPFQVMVGSGFFMLFVSTSFFTLAFLRRRLPLGKNFLRLIAVTLPLGFIAIEAGWFVTEFGRQPWIVWHVMRVSEAATPQSGVVYVLLVFAGVYLALTAGLILLLLIPNLRPTMPRRMRGPEESY
jgi:cytochrome bd ubiquinol oxidase subunit I